MNFLYEQQPNNPTTQQPNNQQPNNQQPNNPTTRQPMGTAHFHKQMN
jgi:hypothetical protein